MSIKQEYFNYLNHFRETVALWKFHAQSWQEDLIALRHDVDHDLDIALEMSYWEKEMGFKATYFLLPTAPYWTQDGFLDKALQIQDFGHEVGLHLNVITEWLQGETNDPFERMRELLGFLRNAGVKVHGVSAHGDKLCYEKNFVNSWLFSELRPEDPVARETRLNAEGIRAQENEKWIAYPHSHALRQEDGRELPFWTMSMEKLALSYEAMHLSYDGYFTDSGGQWKRSSDPLNQELTRGRHQILIHPEYWRGSQKIFFFLSTARSGSKWLVNILNKATPVTARHEFTLNHCYRDGNWVAHHRTGPGFTSLVRDKENARDLILDSRTWIEEQGKDFAEANVYLERFLALMQEIFPDAVFVHLHRNPADVVRSIINRSWYDSPLDDRHPIMEVPGWSQISQFEKACWYVHVTNENLLRLGVRLRFENMVSESSYLEKCLRSVNIPFYPRLARDEYANRINANLYNEFPQYENWPQKLKETFQQICGSINSSLGYGPDFSILKCSSPRQNRDSYHIGVLGRPSQDTVPETLLDIDLRGYGNSSGFTHHGCRLQYTGQGLEVIPEKGRHAYVLLGGGDWEILKKNAGWEHKVNHYYQGSLRVRVHGSGTARLFSLMYDKKGALTAKRLLKKIAEGVDELDFSFKVRSNASRFNLALHVNKENGLGKLVIELFRLRAHAVEISK